MTDQLFSQRDPQWSGKQLGWGPPGSTIGLYGCDLTCDAMIAWNSFGDMHYSPSTLDDAYINAREFAYDSGGDYDLLKDAALAEVWPERFSVETVWGYDAARVAAAIASPNVWVKFWISYGSVSTHFVIAAGGNAIYDPWYGTLRTLSGYGGPIAVKKMIFVTAKPVAPPPPPPPPPPVYSASGSDGVTIEKGTINVGTAEAEAQAYASAHPGVTVTVKNDKGITDKTYYVAPPPVYSARATDGTVVEAGTTDAVKADAEAQAYADTHPNVTVTVIDDKGAVQKTITTAGVYSVEAEEAGVDIVTAIADLATAQATADQNAAGHLGVKFVVEDQQDTILYTALVPKPAPKPLPSAPPPYGLSPQVLAALQTLLIAIGRFLARERR